MSYPIGIVPCTGGRAALPSAKKSLGFWNLTLDCRFMSPKKSIGGAVLCSPRVPSSATAKAQNKTNPMRKFLIMLVKQRHVLPANFFQELAGNSIREAGIRGFNDQEKCIIGNAPELFIIKNRVV